MNKSKLKDVLSTSLYFLGVIVITFLVIKYVGQRTEVIGRSMEPTLADGDNLIVDKITYVFREPKRGEIVVFPYRDQSGVYYIKRIIAIPDDTIYINESGHVYINDRLVEEDYIKELANDAGIASTPVRLGEDEYFVMGDNRNNSTDSRSVTLGVVHRDEIIGRAFVRIWPLKDFKILEHK